MDQQWLQAVAAKDANRTASFYATDARMMPPNEPPVVGADQIKKQWAEMYKLPGMSLTFEPSVVRVSPDGQMAYDVGTYSLSMDGQNGPVRDDGKYTVVWQKRDGKWQAVVDMFSSNLPPQRPPQ